MTLPANLVMRAGLFLCIFLGVALQIQASIGIQADYSGLRINLGDLALPFAGLFVLLTLAFKKSEMPRWEIPFGIFWPLLLTGIMSFALLHGRAELGEWSQWALMNKYAGWLVLMAYFGLGAWLVTNIGNPTVKAFLQSFTIFLLTTIFCGIIILTAKDFFPEIFSPIGRQLKGLMGNRNAFAFVILIIFLMLSFYKLSEVKFLATWVLPCFNFFLPLIFVFNGSRIATGAAFILLPVILAWLGRKAIKSIFLPFFLGMLLVTGLYCINEKIVFREHQNIYTADLFKSAKSKNLNYEHYKSQLNYVGDTIRLRVLKDSFNLWKEHPIIGAGLGIFLNYQKEKYKDNEAPVLDIIDSTPLWLLTETGLLGLSVFFTFYGFVLWTCWKNRKSVTDDLGVLRVSLLLILTGFAIMSLFHELLYARHLWFMMGMALAVPKKHPA